MNKLKEEGKIGGIEDKECDDFFNSYFQMDTTVINDAGDDSFFMLRGESMFTNTVIGTGMLGQSFNLETMDDFQKFEISMKPRGNALTRLFSASYSCKDLYVYSDGSIKITSPSRANNHCL